MIKMKKEVHILFVYGSLMTGEYNHDYYLADACCLGQASIFGFALYNLGSFPGIKHTEEPFRVCGELYEVNQSDFDRICMLEGNGYLYQCEPVIAVLEDSGESVAAEVFVYLGKVYKNELFPGDVQNWKEGNKDKQ